MKPGKFIGILLIALFAILNILFLSGQGFVPPAEPKQIMKQADAHPDGRCIGLGWNEEFDALLSTAELVFLGGPDKAGGTSIQRFVKECVGAIRNPTMCINKWNCESLYLASSGEFSSSVDKVVEAPKLIGSHITKDQTLIRMFRNSNKHQWIVYVHRDETDRLASAIQQVVSRDFEKLRMDPKKDVDGKPVLDEQKLIQHIQSRPAEIRHGGAETLTCDMYDAIQEHAPNLLFVDLKQLNNLQTILSKHFCPERTPDVVHANVAAEKRPFLVQMPTAALVEFHQWLDGKRHVLEWAIDHGRNRTCLGKTKHMEGRVLGCPHNAFLVTNI